MVDQLFGLFYLSMYIFGCPRLFPFDFYKTPLNLRFTMSVSYPVFGSEGMASAMRVRYPYLQPVLCYLDASIAMDGGHWGGSAPQGLYGVTRGVF